MHNFILTRAARASVPFLLLANRALKSSRERLLHYNVFDSPTYAHFGRALQHASRRRAATDPHPGNCRMRKTAVCGRVHAAHNNRCLPGEGRQVKTWLLNAGGARCAAPVGGTRTRFYEPARSVVTVDRDDRKHPAGDDRHRRSCRFHHRPEMK